MQTTEELTLADEVVQLLDNSLQQARLRRRAFCSPEQLLETALTELSEGWACAPVTAHLEADPSLPYEPRSVELSKVIRERILPRAQRLAREAGQERAGSVHLLGALLGPASNIPEPLRTLVAERLRQTSLHRDQTQVLPAADSEPRTQSKTVETDSARAEATDFLFPVEVTSGHELVDCPREVARVLQTLLFGNPLVIGPEGAGKRSVLELAVQRVASGECPSQLKSLDFQRLDYTRLLAGTAYRGELEERVVRLVDAMSRSENTVLCVDDLHLLVPDPRNASSPDLASALLPALKSGKVRVIGTVTHDMLRERLESSPAFLSHFTAVSIDAPAPNIAAERLEPAAAALSLRLGVDIDSAAVREACDLCAQYVSQRALPKVAIDLLQATAARLRYECSEGPAETRTDDTQANASLPRVSLPAASGPEELSSSDLSCSDPPLSVAIKPRVGPREIRVSLSELYRIPFEHLESDVRTKLEDLEKAFFAQIFGQDHAFAPIAEAARAALTGLSDPRRPRGKLFFLGPPGTGKTESARFLARSLMGSDDALLRFDMSDYKDASSAATLLGSDRGLVQSEQGGRMTEPMRENPNRVILFDEIEKAHPSIFDVLLSVLDEGMISDKLGRRASFRHAFIIFTSNAGRSSYDGTREARRLAIEESLSGVFSAAFLNRIEEFVVFQELNGDALCGIAERELIEFGARLQDVQGKSLTWTPGVPQHASEKSEPNARSVQRFVRSEIASKVIRALLDQPSAEKLCVGVVDGAIVVEHEGSEDAAPPGTA